MVSETRRTSSRQVGFANLDPSAELSAATEVPLESGSLSFSKPSTGGGGGGTLDPQNQIWRKEQEQEQEQEENMTKEEDETQNGGSSSGSGNRRNRKSVTIAENLPDAGAVTEVPSPDETIRRSNLFQGEFSHDTVASKYILYMDAVIGRGTYGVVSKCKNKDTGEVCAVKVIDKRKLGACTQTAAQVLCREVKLLLDLDHPHIIKLHDVYEDRTNIYLVNEYCSGGELYDRVVEKTQSKEGHFSEYSAARIIKNILSAIRYCHDDKQIVHRDLKPENFLLTDNTDDAQVKIIDFGLSRYAKKGRMQSEVGTIYYVAPEVLTGDYTDKADIWSIGVVTYVLLCGFPPFNAGSEKMTYDILHEGACDVKFPAPAWNKITPAAIQFIRRLLTKDPIERPSAAEALQDDWIINDHVVPLSKKKMNWRGTFLGKDTPEAKKIQKEAPQVEYVMKDHQKTFHRMLQTLQLDKQRSRNNVSQQNDDDPALLGPTRNRGLDTDNDEQSKRWTDRFRKK